MYRTSPPRKRLATSKPSSSFIDYPVVTSHSSHRYSLELLPHDILLAIISHLHNFGSQHTQALALTCKRLYLAVRSITRHGDIALSLNLSRRISNPGPGISIKSTSSGVSFQKNGVPGDAFLMFDRCICGTSSFWRFRIDRFCGLRIEIGVARPAAFRHGTVERAKSWSFDCFGRVCVAGEQRTFGRQMKVGDVVGVLYDAKGERLCFMDNGISMGVIEGVGRGQLLPFIYLPYVKGEQVTLLNSGATLSVSSVLGGGQKWRRVMGLQWEECIIVQTWNEKVWYGLRMDPETSTLAELWCMLEDRVGMRRELFELIWDGKRLGWSEHITLSQVGIHIDQRTGTCKKDILLSVPHIVS